MQIKNPLTKPVCPAHEVTEQTKFSFNVIYKGKKRAAFLIRFKGQIYGYLNQCVHMPKPLDCEATHIFDETGQFLRCSMHGICYDPVTGASVSALCEGEKLTALKTLEESEWVYLTDKKAELDISSIG